MGGMMGGGMKGMFMKPWKMMMVAKELGLSDDQMGRIRDIFTNTLKQKVKIECDIKLRKIDLRTLLMQDEVNMQEVEQKIREIANLKADKKIVWIRAMQDMRNVLTPDQREGLKTMMMSWWKKGGMAGMGDEPTEEEDEESEAEEETEEG
jgi:Spy/CpxP family protein refolding chaperone